MSSKYRFRFHCSFADEIFYRLDIDGQERELVHRIRASEYWQKLYNGTPEEWARDIVATIGKIRFHNHYQMTADVVAAFNAWKLQEHERSAAQILGNPQKYGEIAANDPIRQPYVPAEGINWNPAGGWERLDNKLMRAA